MTVHPVTPESVAAAKQAQAAGREAFTQQTGYRITDDGRIGKREPAAVEPRGTK